MEALATPPAIGEQFDRYIRTYNDVTTWLAETLDGAMRTPFEYRFAGHDFIAEDGSRLGDIFETAITDAERMARRDPALAFESRRRRHELDEHSDMLAMARGELPNTMVVVSDFPSELMHAQHDVGGYNVTRKQTMLRVLTYDNGRLKMYSQSLDGSHRPALEAIYQTLGVEARPGELLGQRLHLETAAEDQVVLLDRLVGVYDRALAGELGGNWYAGRQEAPRDTYQFVLSQHAVVDRLVERQLAGNCTDRDIYNSAALLSRLFSSAEHATAISRGSGRQLLGGFVLNLEAMLETAGQQAAAEGRTFSGCGASLSAAGQLGEAGYGNRAEEKGLDYDITDSKGSLTFTCPKGHTNTRRRGELFLGCKVCRTSVSC